MVMDASNRALTAQTSKEQLLLVQLFVEIMDHNFVEMMPHLQLLTHVRTELVYKIIQLKVIKIVINGFYRLVMRKAVFGMELVDASHHKIALHFRAQPILVLNSLP